MRIGLFSDTFPPELNGVANSTYILRNQLEKMGHEVFVITTRAGVGHARWDDDHKVLRLAGMELSFLYGYVATMPMHMHGFDEVRKLDLDVIHVQTEFGVGIFARICAKQLEIPLVSTYHTTYEDYTHYVNLIHSNAVDSVVKGAVAKLSKLYGDSSMEVIAPSRKTKDMLLRYRIRREIDVIPTGLPLDSFSPDHLDPARSAEIRSEFGIPSDATLVIYVGRIAEEKSLDLVIRGFAEALSKGTEIYLLIVGGGPDLEHIRQLIADMNVGDHVKSAGPKPSELVPDYYRAANAFISASLSETQGMTFIEAMASGLPLFARRDEVLEKLIETGVTGWYFEGENDLSELLSAFANRDEAQSIRMKEACLERVIPYSAEIFGQRVEVVYNRVINDYHNRLTVEEVRIKGNIVKMKLVSDRGEEVKVQLSIDDYYNFGIRENGRIGIKTIQALQEREEGTLAFQKCLNRISYKDRSRKEIEDWLIGNTECDEMTREEIIEKLEEKHFIDDKRFTLNMIDHCRNMLMGREKIIRTIQRHGIRREMIEELLDDNITDEEANAFRYAEKVIRTHGSDSVRKIRNMVRMKLIEQGYSSAIAEEVAQEADYTSSESREIDNLQKCAEKAKRRYEKKYSGSMLRNRIFRYCAVQGYSEGDIYAIIDAMEVDDD